MGEEKKKEGGREGQMARGGKWRKWERQEKTRMKLRLLNDGLTAAGELKFFANWHLNIFQYNAKH